MIKQYDNKVGHIQYLILILAAYLLHSGSIQAQTNPLTIQTNIHEFPEPIPSISIITNEIGDMVVVTNEVAEATPASVPVDPEIIIDTNGARARGGGHEVLFYGNLNRQDSLEIHLPAGGILKGHVTAVAVSDGNGNREWVGLLQDCQGGLVEGTKNRVVFPDAFKGLKASVLYTYHLMFFQQDVVLQEPIVLPDNIDPATAVLEVWSEFFDNPQPRRSQQNIPLRDGKDLSPLANNSAVDETLGFGSMQMASGKILLDGIGKDKARYPIAPVAKSWLEKNGRTFLVESSDFQTVRQAFENLDSAGESGGEQPYRGSSLEKDVPVPDDLSPIDRTAGSMNFKLHEKLAKSTIKETLRLDLPPELSLDHGDNKPFLLALAQPQRGVVLDFILINITLVNVNFGNGTAKYGPAAAGSWDYDYWNHYIFPTSYFAFITNLCDAFTNYTGIGITVQNAPGQWYNTTGDAMYNSYVYGDWPPVGISIQLTNIPPGYYDLYLYGHGADDAQYSRFTVNGSEQLTAQGNFWSTNFGNNWVEGVQYVRYTNLQIDAARQLSIAVQAPSGDYQIPIINGLQLAAVSNLPPTVNAHSNVTITLPATATLNGYFKDEDGLPIGAVLTWSWSLVKGPTNVTFGTPSGSGGTNASTTASFSKTGMYTIRLSVSDTHATGYDDIVVSVFPQNSPFADTVWVDDALPDGAIMYANDDAWTWFTDTTGTFSGIRAHESSVYWGIHQHYFTSATTPMVVGTNDILFVYVYIESNNVPETIMVQWLANDETWWNHRAYWGTSNGLWTPNYQVSPSLPAPGGWVRLEVPANVSGVDLGGKSVVGMAFTLYAGSAKWDRAGKSTASALIDTDGDGISDGDEVFLYGSDPRLLDTDQDGRTDYQEIQEGTDPCDSKSFEPKRLAWFRFNGTGTNWANGEQGQIPLLCTGTPISSFDGNAISVIGTNSLKYKIIETNNTVNFNILNGAMRFLFKPNWDTLNTNNGIENCRLFEVGSWHNTNNPGWFALYFNHGGKGFAIACETTTNDFTNNLGCWYTYREDLYGTNYITNEFYLMSNVWNEIVLDYATNYSSVYINGKYLGTGERLISGFNHNILTNGITFGSDSSGWNYEANGSFDEIELFNYHIGYAGAKESGRTFSMTASSNPNQITLNWRQNPRYGGVSLDRSPDYTNWTNLTSGNTNWSYVDSGPNLEVGKLYYYKLTCWNGDSTLTNYLKGGISLPVIEDRGRCMLLVDSNVTQNCMSELLQYKRDLIADGWRISLFTNVPTHDDYIWSNNVSSISNIKTLIQTNWNLYSNELKSVFLIGHLPIPYAGTIAEDGHAYVYDDHRGAWPADGFYGDCIQESNTWTDTTSITNVFRTVNNNATGDGKYDDNTYTNLEIAVGRIDFSNMDYFTSNILSREMDLYKKYFSKAHNWRTGVTTLPHTSILMTYLPTTPDDYAINYYMVDNVIRNAQMLFGSSPNVTYYEDSFIEKTPALICGMTGYGGDNCIFDIYNHPIYSSIFTTNIIPSHIFMLSGSWMGDWNSTNNMLRATLSMNDYGLIALWSMQKEWRLNDLAIGDSFGASYLNTINKYSSYSSRYRSTTILGDPTLRGLYFAPPQGTYSITNANQRTIHWEYPGDSDILFNVYRSTNGIDGQFTRLNSDPISFGNRQYLDFNSITANTVYQVRALKVINNGCGSFTNGSQAAIYEP